MTAHMLRCVACHACVGVTTTTTRAYMPPACARVLHCARARRPCVRIPHARTNTHRLAERSRTQACTRKDKQERAGAHRHTHTHASMHAAHMRDGQVPRRLRTSHTCTRAPRHPPTQQTANRSVRSALHGGGYISSMPRRPGMPVRAADGKRAPKHLPPPPIHIRRYSRGEGDDAQA